MAGSGLLQAIGDILRPELMEPGPICLKETDPGSTCQPVTLSKSGLAVVLKLDSQLPRLCKRQDCDLTFTVNDRFFPLFRQGVEGLTAICDYAIFYSAEEEKAPVLYVFLCELKSGRRGHAHQQIENGKLLTEYILGMAEHHGKDIRSRPEVRYRGLVFSPMFRAPKGSLKPNRCPYVQSTGRMKDLSFIHYPAGVTCDLTYFCA